MRACELVSNPQAFHNTRVRVTTFVEYEFENFTFSDPACLEPPSGSFSVWVTFGGSRSSGAIYCCPGEGGGRATPTPYPLVEDSIFKAFHSLLTKERDTIVRFTVVGTFLAAGKEGGYGHIGCCSLFVLERVESFDPHPRKDLDYSASLGSGEIRLACRESSMWQYDTDPLPNVTGDRQDYQIREQAAADSGERSWLFDDPQRVALEAMRKAYGDGVTSVKRVKASPSRQVFVWSPAKDKLTTVVVARPYLLSLSARSTQVAWVVTSMVATRCEK